MTDTKPHKHWRIAVETSGELIVAIETEMLAGRELSEQDEATVDEAARHLLNWVGRPHLPEQWPAENKSDGRPCTMDLFVSIAMDDIDDVYDFKEACRDWCQGAWAEALEYLSEKARAEIDRRARAEKGGAA
ncbi:hypothetical protein [Martelella mangrovi]|uniref:dATP/dGTP diphosphohydrolase MazZ domain-containing protein n=1 Tax=Martelella mangrovi TaxID=1397477 RepID=A0ABV2IDN6_9HYPH